MEVHYPPQVGMGIGVRKTLQEVDGTSPGERRELEGDGGLSEMDARGVKR